MWEQFQDVFLALLGVAGSGIIVLLVVPAILSIFFITTGKIAAYIFPKRVLDVILQIAISIFVVGLLLGAIKTCGEMKSVEKETCYDTYGPYDC